MNAQLQPSPLGQVILGLPADDYHVRELGTASSGVLNLLRTKTPAHVKQWAKGQDHDTPAKRFGRAYHCRIFEPEVYAERYTGEPQGAPNRPSIRQVEAAKPSMSTIEAIEFWEDWDANNAGKIILSSEHFEQIEEMRAGLMLDDLVAALLFDDDGENEVTMRWVDEHTGVPCKARADRWKRRMKIMCDLKSAEDLADEAFRRAIANNGYHVQHAHYSAGAAACGEPLDEYLIVGQEKEAPFLGRIFRITAPGEARGYELRERGMQTLKACRESGKWPGYAGITDIDLPPWELKDFDA